MKKKFEILMIVVIFAFTSYGCMRAISKEIRSQIHERITIKQVIEDPDSFRGKMVLWGGVIVESRNLKEGTLIEIVQKPLTTQDRPRNVDQSEGRFLALYHGYLDVAIYSEGREVTVAGRLKGIKAKTLGEIEYSYPYILSEEIHLWPPRKERQNYYPYWHSPWWYPYPYRMGLWYY